MPVQGCIPHVEDGIGNDHAFIEQIEEDHPVRVIEDFVDYP